MAKCSESPHARAFCLSRVGEFGNVAFVIGAEEEAHLIAAAPDLLAALERLAGWTRDLRFGYGMRGPEQPLDQARAAIAKAKGSETVAP